MPHVLRLCKNGSIESSHRITDEVTSKALFKFELFDK
jgi:hypothetical protein